MSEVEQRFTGAVAAIGGVLKAHGFRKKRYVWTRVGDGVVHIVDVQRSHGNTASAVRFYVNVAAYVAAFDRAIGTTVPDDLTKATPQYSTRFEEVSDWPTDRVDVGKEDDDTLTTALPAAIEQAVAHLDTIVDAPTLAEAMIEGGWLLDDGLFAWLCVTDADRARALFDAARARFGEEDRWPRLALRFERAAEEYRVVLP